VTRPASDAPSLFDAAASIEAGRFALADTASKHARDIAELVPLARELATRSPTGVTISDVRLYAQQRGLLTGTETGRRLSYLGAVMQQAGLQATGEWRRSSIVKSHGNVHRVYVLR
jgi:hypothetical protein